MKYKCLDLFCGAGGASYGYLLAGFDVTGVDIKSQPHYHHNFIKGDALEIGLKIGHEFDFIHASPPCQFGSELTPPKRKELHPNLIPITRELLQNLGKPYIIENVEGVRGHLINAIKLCGSMFNLPIWRHRYFENNIDLFFSPASCRHNYKPIIISGMSSQIINGERVKRHPTQIKLEAMQIDWMNRDELSQAIPPAYTKWLGQQIISNLKGKA